jgi:hypothetical protein
MNLLMILGEITLHWDRMSPENAEIRNITKFVSYDTSLRVRLEKQCSTSVAMLGGARRLRFQQQFRRVQFSTETLQKTALYDHHLSIGGKVGMNASTSLTSTQMVPFAGYYLPVQYEGLGVLKGPF